MFYTLMHKEIEVAKVDIDESSGIVEKIHQMFSPEHAPLPMQYEKNPKAGLHLWLQHRSVPKTRKGLRAILESAGVETSSALSLKSLGLNLSDHYWFRPDASDLTWEKVNLFQNDFATQQYTSHGTNESVSSSFSPDYSSNGDLRKYWTIRDKERVLLKEGAEPYFQEPYNEEFASRLLDVLDVPHVGYHTEIKNGIDYSVCPTFCSPDLEYISAYNVLFAVKQDNSENSYQHFFRCIDQLAIPCERLEIDNMLGFDYLIQNSDRHWGNFGFLRNPDTLEFIGIAPLFDHGNSLWHKSLWRDMFFSGQESKPFRTDPVRQLQLADKFILPFELIDKKLVDQLANEVFTKNKRMEEYRISRIIDRVGESAKYLCSLQNKHTAVAVPVV